MSKVFNLLSLHSPSDIHPRTWVCIKGKKIKSIVKSLEKEILSGQKLTRESLSGEISTELKCSKGTIKRILQGNSNFYPIPVILKLLDKSNRKEIYSKIVQKNIKYLKINSASAKPVKSIRNLTTTLAKILGAFMADGSLSVQILISNQDKNDLNYVINKLKKHKFKYSTGKATSRNQYYIAIQINSKNKNVLKIFNKHRMLIQSHYNIELTEEYKDSVIAFNQWIYKIFMIKPTSFYKKRNAWRTIFSNKILARFLMSFFDVIPGPKTYTAFEPDLIKKSNLKMRKSFAKGVLMFDGSVSKSNKIVFSSKSKLLHSSIKNIWKLDKIEFSSYVSNRNEWILSTTETNNKLKFFDYFEKNTQKNKLLHWISGDKKYKPIIHYKQNNLSVEKILDVIKKIKICDIKFLERTFNVRHITIRYYLKILKNHRKIKISRNSNGVSNFVDKNSSVFLEKEFHDLIFNKIRQLFIKDKNFSSIINTSKGTFSAWRKRKNGIPLYILKEICKILNINFSSITTKIESVDRDIVEII